ncbi:hypothetical protein HK100_002340 [Physocladia obscura]|uniref:SH3 domain-containing protein n=1 Tax=Physocladia obscura TaxID=109957 RepID=A0AAD5SVX2_9FUNG|nr:hypothetical protein HK100_002340 [Physocladia obscura]
MSSSCFSLAESAECGQLTGQFIAASGSVQDTTSLDAYVASALSGSAFATYGCPNYDTHHIRFQQSLICHSMVVLSHATCGNQSTVTYIPFCHQACIDNLDSVELLFNNSAVCDVSPAASVMQARDSFNSTQLNTCANLFPTVEATTCSMGLSVELENVGFKYPEDAVSFCANIAALSLQDSKMCASFLAGMNSTSQLLPVPLSQLTTEQKLALLLPARTLPYMASGIAWVVMVSIGVFWGRATIRIAQQNANKPDRQHGFLRGSFIESVISDLAETDVNTPGTNVSAANSWRRSVYDYIFGNRNSRIIPSVVTEDDDAILLEPNVFKRTTQTHSFGSGRGGGGGSGTSKKGKMQAIAPYVAADVDEISLAIGDIVTVKENYGDEWCLVKRVATGAVGFVPVACLDFLGSKSLFKAKVMVPQRTASKRTFGR